MQQTVCHPPGDELPLVRLSKSKVAAYETCPRRLWLQLHRPALRRFDEATLKLFAAGHLTGELARVRYPQGILVAEGPKEIDQAIVRTTQLIGSAVRQPIFEAAFRRDNVVIRADILEPDGWGGWKLIEVKNARAVREYQYRDAATQHWVITGSRLCLSSVIIRHVERPLRSERDLLRTHFVDADVTAEVQAISANRKRVVDAANATARAGEPNIAPGLHCVRPFKCEFCEHCSAHSAGRA